jgi:hypothetical protein
MSYAVFSLRLVGTVKLCEACLKRPATCHTNLLGFAEGLGALCKECFEALAPFDAKRFESEARAAVCKYCGGFPCVGGTDDFESGMDARNFRFMCFGCTQEFLRVLEQKLGCLPKGMSREDQMAAIQAAKAAVELHMEDWAKDRN